MRAKRFEWEGARATAAKLRLFTTSTADGPDVSQIEREVEADRDAAVRRLTARFDATKREPDSLLVDPEAPARALAELDPALRASLELAAANIRAVAEAQPPAEPRRVGLPQGQSVTIRELAVGAAGIYAPGGRAAYPSSVLMCAIPARVAGVGHVGLATPPRPDGTMHPVVLAAAALAEVDEVYAMGGAQAIFALAYGTETVRAVDVIAGPGNAWVQEAKRRVYGSVGIDSYAGPSELMLVADRTANPRWAALDICSQAEHGGDGALVAVAVDAEALAAIESATYDAAARRPNVHTAPFASVRVPDIDAAMQLANAFAPEHLQLMVDEAESFVQGLTTAGCVFVGPYGATAFGDYVAGSNHVLPTGGAGRFSGPLGPAAFRRRISSVQVSADAAAKLAPHVDAIAKAEGFPVHGESAMIRTEEGA